MTGLTERGPGTLLLLLAETPDPPVRFQTLFLLMLAVFWGAPGAFLDLVWDAPLLLLVPELQDAPGTFPCCCWCHSYRTLMGRSRIAAARGTGRPWDGSGPWFCCLTAARPGTLQSPISAFRATGRSWGAADPASVTARATGCSSDPDPISVRATWRSCDGHASTCSWCCCWNDGMMMLNHET